jgi:hypothetical protein
MIIKLLIILLFIVLFFVLLALFSPIYCMYNSKDTMDSKSVFVLFIIHPSVFRISYPLSIKKFKFCLFNLFHFPSPKKAAEPDDTISKDEPAPEEEEIKFDKDEVSETYDYVEEEDEAEIESTYQKEEPAPEYVPPPIEKEPEDKRHYKEKPEDKEQKEEVVEESVEETKKPGFFSKFEKWKKLYHFIINQKKIAKKGMRWLLRFVKRLFTVIKFDYFAMDIKAGFENPVYTGMSHGVFTGLHHTLDLEDNRLVKLNFEPTFDNKDSFEFDSAVSIRTTLFRILIPVIEALILFPYISAFILWRRIKKFKAAPE